MKKKARRPGIEKPRMQKVAIHTARVEAVKSGKEYRVEIEGGNLWPAISPPRVTVGNVPLRDLRFGKEGTSLTGTLPRRPDGRKVVVDYGFARGEFTLAKPITE